MRVTLGFALCTLVPLVTANTDDGAAEGKGWGTSQDYKRFDQVDKPKDYLLAEDTAREEFDTEFQIPTIDMSLFWEATAENQGHALFADAFGAALEEIGFAVLINHRIDQEVYRRAEDLVTDVFTAHSLEEKLKYRATRHG